MTECNFRFRLLHNDRVCRRVFQLKRTWSSPPEPDDVLGLVTKKLKLTEVELCDQHGAPWVEDTVDLSSEVVYVVEIVSTTNGADDAKRFNRFAGANGTDPLSSYQPFASQDSLQQPPAAGVGDEQPAAAGQPSPQAAGVAAPSTSEAAATVGPSPGAAAMEGTDQDIRVGEMLVAFLRGAAERDMREAGVQAASVLTPDAARAVLHNLLAFLREAKAELYVDVARVVGGTVELRLQGRHVEMKLSGIEAMLKLRFPYLLTDVMQVGPSPLREPPHSTSVQEFAQSIDGMLHIGQLEEANEAAAGFAAAATPAAETVAAAGGGAAPATAGAAAGGGPVVVTAAQSIGQSATRAGHRSRPQLATEAGHRSSGLEMADEAGLMDFMPYPADVSMWDMPCRGAEEEAALDVQSVRSALYSVQSFLSRVSEDMHVTVVRVEDGVVELRLRGRHVEVMKAGIETVLRVRFGCQLRDVVQVVEASAAAPANQPTAPDAAAESEHSGSVSRQQQSDVLVNDQDGGQGGHQLGTLKPCDIFLSHTGAQKPFIVSHLVDRLHAAFPHLEVFVDYETRGGDGGWPEIQHRLAAAKCVVFVLSWDFVRKWYPMQELLQCMARVGQQILVPVFSPTLPYKKAEALAAAYAESMDWPEGEVKPDSATLNQWAKAVADLLGSTSALLSEKYVNEAKLVEAVVKDAVEQLRRAGHSCTMPRPLPLPAVVVDLEGRQEAVIKALGQHRMLLLHGLPGVGKTTLAMAVVKMLRDDSSQQQVRRAFGIVRLRREMSDQEMMDAQKDLLLQLLPELHDHLKSNPLRAPAQGTVLMRDKLCGKEVLILVDNVWDPALKGSGCLDRLLPEGLVSVLGLQSRVLVTSRHSEAGDAFAGCHSVKVDRLQPDAALQLFCIHAFGSEQPPSEPTAEAELPKVLQVCGGLPMALEVTARYLQRNPDRWKKWSTYLTQVFSNKATAGRVHEEDRVLFTALDRSFSVLTNSQQHALLDIALLLDGQLWEDVYACYGYDLELLNATSLVSSRSDGRAQWRWPGGQDVDVVEVHETVQEFCRAKLADGCWGSRVVACDIATQQLETILKPDAQGLKGRYALMRAASLLEEMQCRVLSLREAYLLNAWPTFMPRLHFLELLWPQNDTLLREGMPFSETPELRVLRVRGDDDLLLAPLGLPKLLHLRLMDVQLHSGCKGALARLPSLQVLQLHGVDNLTSLDLAPLASLTQLEVSACAELDGIQVNDSLLSLRVFGCSSLVTLAACPAAPKPALQAVRLVHCTALKKLDLTSFPSLEDLAIQTCPGLRSIIGAQQQLLRGVEVRDCAWLLNVEVTGCSMLARLDIRSCPKLWGLKLTAVLPCLELLRAVDCPKLHDLQASPGVVYVAESAQAPQHLQALKEVLLVGSNSLNQLSFLSGLDSLELLDVSGCSQLTSLEIRNCIALAHLKNLHQCIEDLHITSCGPAKLDVSSLKGLVSLEVDASVLTSKKDGSSFLDLERLTRLKVIDNLTSPCGPRLLLEIADKPTLKVLNIGSFVVDLPIARPDGVSHMTHTKDEQIEINGGYMRVLDTTHYREVYASQGMSATLVKAPYLTSLCLRGCSELQSVCGFSGWSTRLCHLRLDNCHKLEQLRGASCLTQLARLSVRACPKLQLDVLSSLTMLRSLKLASLPKLKQLPIRSSMSNLACLELEDCPELQLFGLSKISWLSSMMLHGLPALTQLADIHALGLLKKLHLTACPQLQLPDLSNLVGIEDIKLQHLTALSQLGSLCRLGELRTLYLGTCEFTELHGLSSFAKLTSLVLIGCPQLQLLDMSNLTSIELIDLAHLTALSQLGSLHRLGELRTLRLSSCAITELQGLSSIRKLTSLELIECPELQLLDVSNLTSIERINLAHLTALSQLGSLYQLGKLRTLCLRSCALTELQGLSNIAKLKNLELIACPQLQLLDVSNLAGIERMDLQKLPALSQLGSLRRLRELRTLYLSTCAVTELQGLASLQSLRQLEVRHCHQLLHAEGLAGLTLTNLHVEDCPVLSVVDDGFAAPVHARDTRDTPLTSRRPARASSSWSRGKKAAERAPMAPAILGQLRELFDLHLAAAARAHREPTTLAKTDSNDKGSICTTKH